MTKPSFKMISGNIIRSPVQGSSMWFTIAAMNLRPIIQNSEFKIQYRVYSDYGDHIWCCFPSNDFGDESLNHPEPLTPGIYTIDRSGQPGYNIRGDYFKTFSGTSSACLGVARTVALMLSVNPELTWQKVKDKIEAISGVLTGGEAKTITLAGSVVKLANTGGTINLLNTQQELMHSVTYQKRQVKKGVIIQF